MLFLSSVRCLLWLLIFFCVLSFSSNCFRIKQTILTTSTSSSSSSLTHSHINKPFATTFSRRIILRQSPSDSNAFSLSDTVNVASTSSTSALSPDEEGYLSEIIFRNFKDIQLGEVKKIGIIGTRSLSKNHQQMIELLSYALVLSGNHVITSGGGSVNGTNLAVIRGALRACNPDLLTVILPQSLSKQSSEVRQLLSSVTNVVELPENDAIGLKEAANICNYQIFGVVEKIIVFAYHNSFTILNSVKDFEKTIETVKFYLD